MTPLALCEWQIGELSKLKADGEEWLALMRRSSVKSRARLEKVRAWRARVRVDLAAAAPPLGAPPDWRRQLEMLLEGLERWEADLEGHVRTALGQVDRMGALTAEVEDRLRAVRGRLRWLDKHEESGDSRRREAAGLRP